VQVVSKHAPNTGHNTCLRLWASM